MKLENSEYEVLSKKLEHNFRNSGDTLVNKLANHEDLTTEDFIKLSKKLEYRFRKSGHPIMEKVNKLSI